MIPAAELLAFETPCAPSRSSARLDRAGARLDSFLPGPSRAPGLLQLLPLGPSTGPAPILYDDVDDDSDEEEGEDDEVFDDEDEDFDEFEDDEFEDEEDEFFDDDEEEVEPGADDDDEDL